MGPGRRYEKNAAGFVLFFSFVVVVALASSCQRSGRAEVVSDDREQVSIQAFDLHDLMH
ncbi:MAG: hypothetical protein K2Z81_27040 [Cyanobacteria bacterium]|nr:hypothetical protein [Cyanobacteriota bacterium]